MVSMEHLITLMDLYHGLKSYDKNCLYIDKKMFDTVIAKNSQEALHGVDENSESRVSGQQSVDVKRWKEAETSRDYGYARIMYEHTADQKILDLIRKWGHEYKKGEGVEQNYVKAFECFKIGAELNDADAQFWLAEMYKDGLGVKKDVAKADEWYQKASENGTRYFVWK